MDGQPLRYRTETDTTFVQYSVGEDGRVDGGDANPMPDKSGSRNIWTRKDVVWPAATLPEEIEAFRKDTKN